MAQPDDVKAAFEQTAQALQRLQQTWDTGFRETMTQLDQMQRLAERLVHQAAAIAPHLPTSR
jgi:hypothetical protein